jgi:hypothetical protein
VRAVAAPDVRATESLVTAVVTPEAELAAAQRPEVRTDNLAEAVPRFRVPEQARSLAVVAALTLRLPVVLDTLVAAVGILVVEDSLAPVDTLAAA